MTKSLLRFLSLLAACVLLLQDTAFAGTNNPQLDPKARPVYRAYTISELNAVLDGNVPVSLREHPNQDVVVTGTVREITRSEPNTTELVLTDGTNEITNTSKKLVPEGLIVGEHVTIYGKLHMSNSLVVEHLNWDKLPDSWTPDFSFDADHIERTSVSALRDDWYLIGGNSYSDKDSLPRTLAGGTIHYRIPKSWAAAEVTGENKNKILNLEEGAGNFYYLNSLTGQSSPECFGIFYFSNTRYLSYDSDNKPRMRKRIERAIITNICPNETPGYRFPTSVKTTDGREYHSYVALYKTWRAEFTFLPAKDGLCVMLSLYPDKFGFTDDALYLMRTLETAE